MNARAVETVATATPAAASPPRRAGPPSIEVATAVPVSDELRRDWIELRSHCGAPTPNTDPDRYAATLGAMGSAVAPYIALARDAGAPCAMLVARTVRRPVVCRVGYLKLRTPKLRCLEILYGGVVTDGDPASAAAVLGHIERLLREGEFDHVLINHLPVEHDLFGPFGRIAAVRKDPEPHWTARLVPGSFEQTMARHSSKHRAKLRRYDRKLVEHFGGDARLEVFTRPDDVARFIRLAADITARSYHGAIGFGVTDSPLWRSALEVEARLGRWRAYALMTGDRAVAYQNGAVYGAAYACDGRGYLPEHAAARPGTILSMRVINDLCEQGVGLVDFGFGDAEYKRTYGTDSTQEATLHLYGRSARAAIARRLDAFAVRASRASVRIVGSNKSLARVKKWWRGRMVRAADEGE